LHKFFNVGEHDSVQPWAIDWSKVTRIMEKRDGSMITPVLTTGRNFKFKTKKTFTSAEAIAAGDHLGFVAGGTQWIGNLLLAGLTPTFEFTSPKFPIVIKYEKDELTLLHIRENATGRYLNEEEIATLASPFPIVQNLVHQFMDAHMEMGCFADDQVSWDKLDQAAKTAEGIEGWVIQFEDGNMVKLKTQWYVALHHSVTFTRWRDIARTVVADQSDDLKGAFAMTGRSIQPILEVERKIKERIDFAREAAQQIVDVFAQVGAGDAKSLALSVKNHPHMGIIMKVFRKQEIDWMAWYAKNHLDDDWSLEVVEVNA
jgi:T4 RnlA family RNA ligase